MAKFKKGQSGNPKGRPKKLQDIAEMIKQSTNDGSACVQLYLSIMEDKEASNKDRIQAASLLLAYAYGKPSQQINANVDHDGSLIIRWAQTEEESK